MASLFIFTLDSLNQADLFLSDSDGTFNLQKFKKLLGSKKYSVKKEKIKSEGFSNIELQNFEFTSFISSIISSQSSLGYYYEARVEGDKVVSTKVRHEYFSKSSLLATSDSQLIIKFDWTAEESAKTRVKTLIEGLGVKLNSLKLNDQLLRTLKETYVWRAAKIDKIQRDGDSTKKISFEIDPSNDQDASLVDEQYSDHGKMSHLTAEIPFDKKAHIGTQQFITVKFYSETGNRIVLTEEEFGDSNDLNNFIIYLAKILSELTLVRKEETI